jgi:spore maturation protein CgeB
VRIKNTKVLFSSFKNPHFESFVEYIEKAFKENGCQILFFENRDFIIPGRIRDMMTFLYQWDIRRLNRRLIAIARSYKPDLFLEAGGWNILPETVGVLRSMGIKTALWTIDPPRIFKEIIEAAHHYNFIFTGGSEAYEILEHNKVNNLHWLPFACDADFHRPIKLSIEEKKRYGCDICFVGSGGELYPQRRIFLESLIDFDLGIWGPGWETLPVQSPLRNSIRGGQTKPQEWVKIFSASKIVFHSHYRDPLGQIPCYQAAPRVYEALACGALLMVDKQRDVLRIFKPGEDLVVFDDVKELQELVAYYLSHPKQAEKIAQKGRKKVLAKHTYGHRIKEILGIVMANDNSIK